MNPMIFAVLVCTAGLVSASGWAGHDFPIAHYGGAHKYDPAPLAHDGRVVDTPEVAHAKAAHLAAHAAAAAAAPAHGHWAGYAGAHGGWAPAPAHAAWAPAHAAWAPAPAAWAPAHGAHYAKYAGPPAHIELTHDGKFLKDTPEVSHAKAAHAAAYSAAAHAAAAQPDHGHYGYGHGHEYGHHGW